MKTLKTRGSEYSNKTRLVILYFSFFEVLGFLSLLSCFCHCLIFVSPKDKTWSARTKLDEHYVRRYASYVLHYFHCSRHFTTSKFHNEYEKVFILFWTLRICMRDFVHVEWLVGPCRKKFAGLCHK